MNLIETIYCSQYYELKKTGRDFYKGRMNGTALIAVMILLLLVSVLVLAGKLGSGSGAPHFLQSFHLSGRFLGKVIGVIGLAVFYGIITLTVGSKDSYERMIQKWQQMPDEELKPCNMKALKAFGIVFLIFMLVMIFAFM